RAAPPLFPCPTLFRSKLAATYELPGEAGIASIAVSRDGRWVVGGGADGVVRLWQVGTPAPAWTSGKEHGGAVFGIVLSNDVGERSEEHTSELQSRENL